MPRKDLLKHVKRVVVKVGSSTITTKDGLDEESIARLVADIASLREKGYEVVLVTSGAISAGRSLYPSLKGALPVSTKQALASLGQTLLIEEYRKKFMDHSILVGQILITEDDVNNRRRFINARHAMNALLDMGAVPVINENDTVVIKEIKFGDNDTLSAHVASLVDAQLLVILSDIDGYYRDLNDDKPLEEIRVIDDAVRKNAGLSGSAMGTGGMATKIKAAEMIMQFGEMLVIANGREEGILQRIINGEKCGTLFAGDTPVLSSRKKWLSLQKSHGRITVDAGAVAAIIGEKKSLLPSGITSVSGTFGQGDPVDIADEKGDVCAKGLVNYSSHDLALIAGHKSGEVKKILGGNFYPEVINRDDLVVANGGTV